MERNDEQTADELRLMIQQHQAEIERQTTTEEQQLQNNAFLTRIQTEMAREDGSLSPETEIEALLLTTWKLEQDLKEIEDRIQNAQPEAEVVESVRTVEEQPVELQQKAESGGIFKALTGWFRKTFSKKPESPMLQEKRRQLQLADEKEREYDLERTKLKEDVFNDRIEGGRREYDVDHIIAEERYADWGPLYVANGWCHKQKLPETDEEGIKFFQAFLRELGNPSVLKNVTPENRDEAVFMLDTGEYSREDFQFLLTHHNAEGVEHIAHDLFDFDWNPFVEKYPIHTCKTMEERKDMYALAFKEMHRYLGISQWLSTCAKDIMTPEQEERFSKGAMRFNIFMNWLQQMLSASDITYGLQEMKEQVMDHQDYYDDRMEHVRERVAIYEEGEAVLRPYEFLQEQMLELGILKRGVAIADWVPKRMIEVTYYVKMTEDSSEWIREKKGEKLEGVDRIPRFQSMLSIEELKQLKSGDAKIAKQFIEELKEFRLVTEEGRPRVIGVESAEEILAHGREDYAYFAEYMKKATFLSGLLAPGSLLAKVYEKQLPQIWEQIQRIQNVHDTIKDMFGDADCTMTVVDANRLLRYQLKDHNWYMRQQVKELSDYERKH